MQTVMVAFASMNRFVSSLWSCDSCQMAQLKQGRGGRLVSLWWWMIGDYNSADADYGGTRSLSQRHLNQQHTNVANEHWGTHTVSRNCRSFLYNTYDDDRCRRRSCRCCLSHHHHHHGFVIGRSSTLTLQSNNARKE